MIPTMDRIESLSECLVVVNRVGRLEIRPPRRRFDPGAWVYRLFGGPLLEAWIAENPWVTTAEGQRFFDATLRPWG